MAAFEGEVRSKKEIPTLPTVLAIFSTHGSFLEEMEVVCGREGGGEVGTKVKEFVDDRRRSGRTIFIRKDFCH